MCRIECIWSEGDQFKFVGRWFATPEETHTGRQAHHTRREVFLTNNTNENNVDCLLRPATVLPPQCSADAAKAAAAAAVVARQRATAETNGADPSSTAEKVDEAAVAAAKAAGDDVFLCEYTYDGHFQRFKRRVEWEEDDFSDDEGGGGAKVLLGRERADSEYRDDFSDDDERSDEEEDDGGEWGAPKGRGGAKKGRKDQKVQETGRRRGRVIRRHITASRRKALASGEGASWASARSRSSASRVRRRRRSSGRVRARRFPRGGSSPELAMRRERTRENFGFRRTGHRRRRRRAAACVYISGVPGPEKRRR